MHTLTALLIFVSFILLLLLLLGLVLFLKASAAVPDKDEIFGPVRPYEDQVRAGRVWFESMEPEMLETTSRDGLRLEGWYLKHPQAKGTILMFHGYHSNHLNDFSTTLPFYYSLGYSLLTVCQRAHGHSEGRYITFGILERHDCVDWAWHLASLLPKDEPIILGGISMGSTTVLMATGESLPPSVCCVVADCGFSSPWDEIHFVAVSKYHLPPHPLMELADLFARLFGGFSYREYTAADAMRTNTLPVLFIHGEDDAFVLPAFTIENYQACRAEKQLLLFPGADHGMSYFADPERYKKAISDFLTRHACRNNEPGSSPRPV